MGRKLIKMNGMGISKPFSKLSRIEFLDFLCCSGKFPFKNWSQCTKSLNVPDFSQNFVDFCKKPMIVLHLGSKLEKSKAAPEKYQQKSAYTNRTFKTWKSKIILGKRFNPNSVYIDQIRANAIFKLVFKKKDKKHFF